jgi:hypothetical protein
MADIAEEQNTQFQLALGDNFYTKGVDSVFDERFKVCKPSNITLQLIWYHLSVLSKEYLTNVVYKLHGF